MAKRSRSSQKRVFKKSKRRKGGKKSVAKTVNRILSTKVESNMRKQPRNLLS